MRRTRNEEAQEKRRMRQNTKNLFETATTQQTMYIAPLEHQHQCCPSGTQHPPSGAKTMGCQSGDFWSADNITQNRKIGQNLAKSRFEGRSPADCQGWKITEGTSGGIECPRGAVTGGRLNRPVLAA
jgi:hypothetical protein